MASMIPKLMLSIDPEKVNESLREIVWGAKDVEEARRVARERDPRCILNFSLPKISEEEGERGLNGAAGGEEAEV